MKVLVFVLPLISISCSSATAVGTDAAMPDEAGVTPDTGTEATEDAGADATQPTVNFADVYAIISSKCGACHTTNGNGGLRMNTEDSAYTALVGVASAECDGETRVIKGDAANSMVVKTLKGTAGCSVPRMPKSRTALSAAEIATFESWINAGAERR